MIGLKRSYTVSYFAFFCWTLLWGCSNLIQIVKISTCKEYKIFSGIFYIPFLGYWFFKIRFVFYTQKHISFQTLFSLDIFVLYLAFLLFQLKKADLHGQVIPNILKFFIIEFITSYCLVLSSLNFKINSVTVATFQYSHHTWLVKCGCCTGEHKLRLSSFGGSWVA